MDNSKIRAHAESTEARTPASGRDASLVWRLPGTARHLRDDLPHPTAAQIERREAPDFTDATAGNLLFSDALPKLGAQRSF